MHAKSLQSCLTLWDPVDHSSPGSSVHGILQARILNLDAMPSFRHLPLLETEPTFLMSPALEGRFFTTSATWEAHIHSDNVILFSAENKWAIKQLKSMETWMHFTKWKKPVWKNFKWLQPYDILLKANYGESEKDQWLPGVGGRDK